MPKDSINAKMRVAVIEENPAQREYLLTLVGSTPGVTVTAAYSGVAEALEQMRQVPPALVLMDVDLPAHSAECAVQMLRQRFPHTELLVLSSNPNPEQLIRILEEGVAGWLQKPCSPDQIMRSILLANEGGALLSSQVALTLLRYFRARGQSVHSLSKREREVLGCLAVGLSADDMARRLSVSKGTIRSHLRKILLKLGVRSQTEALAKYFNPLCLA
jgi:DNA-binding NarL/FixJ family response regulator